MMNRPVRIVENAKYTFINNFREWLDNHHLEYPSYEDKTKTEKFEQFIKDLWEDYGNDIMNVLAKKFGKDIWSNNEVTFVKAVIGGYVKYCHENPHRQIDVETFWKENVLSAMDANEGSFNCVDQNGKSVYLLED